MYHKHVVALLRSSEPTRTRRNLRTTQIVARHAAIDSEISSTPLETSYVSKYAENKEAHLNRHGVVVHHRSLARSVKRGDRNPDRTVHGMMCIPVVCTMLLLRRYSPDAETTRVLDWNFKPYPESLIQAGTLASVVMCRRGSSAV
eukprot:214369-Pyramimonas_sp.AAC.1